MPHPIFTFFLRVNNKLFSLLARSASSSLIPIWSFPVTAPLPGGDTHSCGPLTVCTEEHQGPYSSWIPRVPPSISLFPSAKAAAGRHLSCLPSRQTSLCAQGAGCHGNPQFPFQWGLAAGASPFSGVSQSRSHQATHCFLRTCLEPLIVGSDPLSGASAPAGSLGMQ